MISLRQFLITGAMIAMCNGLTSLQAADLFLKIPGYEGSSTVRGMEGAIIVNSFSMGLSSTGDPADGARRANRAEFRNLTFTKDLDANSPRFALAVADQRIFPTVTLEVHRVTGPGGENKIYEIVLENALITEYSISDESSRTTPPREEIALSYEKITWTFMAPADQTGRKTGSNTFATFDRSKGTGSESTGTPAAGQAPARRR